VRRFSGSPSAGNQQDGHDRSAAVCGCLENFIGSDGTEGKPCKNVNDFRKDEGVQGLFMHSTGVDPKEIEAAVRETTLHRCGVPAPRRHMPCTRLRSFTERTRDGTADQAKSENGDSHHAIMAARFAPVRGLGSPSGQ